MVEKNAPWRKTPLDHWSTDVDPAIMASDEWVGEGDLGEEMAQKKSPESMAAQSMLGRFMHPQHDAEWGEDQEDFQRLRKETERNPFTN